jgi:predicted lipoprotein with Yx(FWY)xxD motif
MMNQTKKVLIILFALFAFAGCASLSSSGGMSSYTDIKNGVLTGKNDMTLYIFAKDAAGSGKSVCNGMCATNWPPLLVEGSPSISGDYSVITRDDGKKQLAYKGMPLYFYAKDTKPGDKIGDGRSEGAWRVIKM